MKRIRPKNHSLQHPLLVVLAWALACGPALALQAPALTGQATGEAMPQERVSVELVIQDVAKRLAAPTITLEEATEEPIALRDDGSMKGDVANDATWYALTSIPRAGELRFFVNEGGQGARHGPYSAPLGTGSATRIVLRTASGDPALVLVDEQDSPTASVGNEKTSADVLPLEAATPTVHAPPPPSGARYLRYALWAGMLLGLMGFGYLRVALRRQLGSASYDPQP